MSRLFRRAGPRMVKDKKLCHLMHGVREQLFSGLKRSPLKAAAEFLSEAVTIEKMLQQRSNLYKRQVSSMFTADTFTATGTSNDCLRKLIRSTVHEELQKASPTPHLTLSSIATVVKN